MHLQRLPSDSLLARLFEKALLIVLLASLACLLCAAGACCVSRVSKQNIDTSTGQSRNGTSKKSSTENNIYTCEWSYFQMNRSLIAFNINHLQLTKKRVVHNGTSKPTPPPPPTTTTTIKGREIDDNFLEGYGSIEAKDFSLSEINLNATRKQLLANGLNPRLPFKIFINGFNTFNQDGEVNGTWIFDVARTFARRGLQNRRRGIEPELEANVLFLTWGIPHIFAESMLAMIPAYYKTMANYDTILNFVSDTLMKMIEFVDDTMDQDEGGWPSESARLEYFSKFEFLGHSLGSHIMTDALNRVRKKYKKHIKFGKFVGLDPAMPCFLSLGHRLAGDNKLANTTLEVTILHSNAGLAGLTTERANKEIVLNGGTFQPGCSWFDFACHHSRSTDIFGYTDDRCQMVAYKCSSYHHFKSGACETCDFDPTQLPSFPLSSAKQSDTYGQNCILVNMPIQHLDTNQTLDFVEQFDDDQIRQLAPEDDPQDEQWPVFSYVKNGRESVKSLLTPLAQGKIFSRAVDLTRSQLSGRAGGAGAGVSGRNEGKRKYFHFVNTSPNFRTGRKTHCLQHYQVRLIVLQNNETVAEKGCPIGSFLTSRSDGIQLKLFHDDDSRSGQQAGGIGWNRMVQGRALKASPTITLGKIIRDNLYTTLLNFEGSPELFVGAELENVDLERLTNCLDFPEDQTSQGVSFVLDLAFMSHTNQKFRHAFSSILCGYISGSELSERSNRTTNSGAAEQDKGRLLLRLCKESQLTTVSSRIDKLLDRIEQERLSENWRVSLLNSLFSLFAEWEPF